MMIITDYTLTGKNAYVPMVIGRGNDMTDETRHDHRIDFTGYFYPTV